ncbi:MAG: Unknown protein [uncultured Sulfurovum sp.]|uniref:Uncharacterized protein n=1 Tax=uncultured Sulfurovum sp. TaxID=269237 RepID=A0A6S6SQ16_9BACT|nr:MAG: Unknown protein [uncultured Sulfurovum sp.]
MNIQTATISELESAAVYGIGVFILYIVAVVAIVGYEIRQAKQAHGIVSVGQYISKSIIYVIGFLLFVTLFMFAITGALPSGTENPSMGIDAFFNNIWLDQSLMTQLTTDSYIKNNGTDEVISAAQTILIIMMIAELVYLVLLFLLFFMLYSFAFSIVGLKYKQGNEEMDMAFVGNVALTLAIAMIGYLVITGITSSLLQSVLELGIRLNKIDGNINTEINIADDLARMIKIGVTKAKEVFN